jgi:H+-translocating NAD(P) transhydrogenase subunit alpha
LVSFLHPAAPSNHKLVKLLQERRITSFTLDSIPRTLSHAQGMDALTSMSTVTGYRSVLMAADRLPRFVPVIGTAVGVTRPARFLILGAGVVGLQAIATAKRLGGVNTAVDIRPEAREQATSLGAKVAGFEVPSELAQGEGGYSSALPEEWLSREREALAPLLAESDVVISSALVPGERAPLLITESMVREMRPGSVLVDVAIDQGGNCSLTRAGEETEVGGILVCGLQNIPGGMPVDSTWLYAQNVCHFVQHLYHAGGADPDLADEIIRATLVTHEGRILHAGTLKAMRELEGSAVSSEA